MYLAGFVSQASSIVMEFFKSPMFLNGVGK